MSLGIIACELVLAENFWKPGWLDSGKTHRDRGKNGQSLGKRLSTAQKGIDDSLYIAENRFGRTS
jgi:hypothetical protein